MVDQPRLFSGPHDAVHGIDPSQDSPGIAVRLGHRGNSTFGLVIAVAQTPTWLGIPAHRRTCNSLVSPVHENKSAFIPRDWQGLRGHIHGEIERKVEEGRGEIERVTGCIY